MLSSGEDLGSIIARNLKRHRRGCGLSLDAAAEMTGVSKSMLGQIERGDCGLSVSTLWKICAGLKVDFATLTAVESTAEVVDSGALQPLSMGLPGMRMYPMFPAAFDRSFEINCMQLTSGTVLDCEARSGGAEKFLLVYAGALDLSLGGKSYRVKAGSSVRYRSDQAYSIANRDEGDTCFYVVTRYEPFAV